MTQLLLPLETPPRYTLDTLIIHDGIRAAMESLLPLMEAARFPMPSTFIHGPAGTGKTHILHALQETLSQPGNAKAMAVHFIGEPGGADRFADLEVLVRTMASETVEPSAVLVDDIHLMGEDEAANLWNLSNQLTRFGYPIVMSSTKTPEEIFSHNPHLQSRIKAGLVFALEPPEDNIRMMILDKMARDRNVRITPDVTHYLVTHKSRSVGELELIVEQLDRASLELKRRITVPLVKLLEKEGTI
jgi:DnaA regulatory inactivator Hda